MKPPSNRLDRIELQSFDVFDTVLTRAVGTPRTSFILLGVRLLEASLISIDAELFADLRVVAERTARRKSGWSEVDLGQIYDELSRTAPLKGEGRERAMALECEIEGDLIRPVPGAVARVAAARERHGRVIFVSDMYLGEPMVRGWLAAHGLWAPGDRLYMSCVIGKSKASGDLFQHVLESEGISAAALQHHGNHPRSDISVPAAAGLATEPFLKGNLNRFELLMESYSAETSGLSSAYAGASRLARLHGDDDRGGRDAIRAVSAGVLAPAVTAFVTWVLLRAREARLSRLYFLSRDGQILVDVARRIAPRLGVECDLRYLHASRQSWHLPGITEIGESQLDWICLQYDFLSVRVLLHRVDVDPGSVPDVLAAIGIVETEWDEQLSPERLERLRAAVLSGPLHDLILRRAGSAREIFLDYLGQEGLLRSDDWAVVDVGWNGRLQMSLGSVLASVGRPAPRGYYFALASRPNTASVGTLDAYSFDLSESARRTISTGVNLPTLMEIACAADHGSVEGFASQSGRAVPVLRTETNQPVTDWGLDVMQQTIQRFADSVILTEQSFDPLTDLLPMLNALMSAFWERPTRREASAWGCFPFENEQGGAAPMPIAVPLGRREWLATVLFRRGTGRSVSCWLPGSLALSPLSIRIAADVASQFARIRRMIMSKRESVDYSARLPKRDD